MTPNQKEQIKELRQRGHRYVDIAAALSISENTVRSFCRRNNIVTSQKASEQENKEYPDHCKQCGKTLKQGKKGHPKKFCSEECRRLWWKENKDKAAKNAYYTVICEECGTEFESYGNSARKFCGHACYIKHRYGKGREEYDACAV